MSSTCWNKVQPSDCNSKAYTPGKFHPPSLPNFSVVRQTLLEKFSERPSRLALIVAPAGFGKTTLLSQFYKQEREAGNNVSWLSADQFDKEPRQFAEHLLIALSVREPEARPVMSRGGHGKESATSSELAERLCRGMASISESSTIIIDDYHQIDNGPIGEMVINLLALMPPNYRIVIASRYRPRFSLAPLMARGQMIEMSGIDLRFTLKEARQLLGPKVSKNAAHQLNKWTQGWGIALQLAKLAVSHNCSGADGHMLPPTISDDLAIYLSEQVFLKLPPDIQNFLIDTSILSPLREELCDEVRQRSDSSSIIRSLRSTYALLIPLSDGSWYNYHPLFSDFLQGLLKGKEPTHAPELHRRAARWYAAQGMLVEAVRHGQEAGDRALVVSIIGDAGGAAIILKHGYSVMQKILSVLAADWQTSIPALLLGKAALLLKDGRVQEAEKYISHVKSDFDAESFPGLETDILFTEMLWTGYVDRGVSQATIDRFERLIDGVPAGDSWLLGWCNTVLFLIYLRWGDLQKSRMYVQRAIRIYKDTKSFYMQSFCFLNVGILHLMAGRQVEAYRAFRAAQRTVQAHFPADPAVCALSNVLLAAIYYERDQLERAAELLEFSLSKAERYDGWTEVYILAYRTRAGILYHQQGLRAALSALERAEETVLQRDLPRLGWNIEIRRAEILLLDGQAAEADSRARACGLYEQLELGSRANNFTWLERRLAAFLLARIALHFGDAERALRLINLPPERHPSQAALVPMHKGIVLTVAYERLNEPERALAEITSCLDAPLMTGRLRALLDEKRLLLPSLERIIRQIGIARLDEPVRDLYDRLRQNPVETASKPSKMLSPRERQVLIQLSRGQSNKRIATELNLSVRTVKFHMQNIFSKLGADNRTKALLIAQNIDAF